MYCLQTLACSLFATLYLSLDSSIKGFHLQMDPDLLEILDSIGKLQAGKYGETAAKRLRKISTRTLALILASN